MTHATALRKAARWDDLPGLRYRARVLQVLEAIPVGERAENNGKSPDDILELAEGFAEPFEQIHKMDKVTGKW